MNCVMIMELVCVYVRVCMYIVCVCMRVCVCVVYACVCMCMQPHTYTCMSMSKSYNQQAAGRHTHLPGRLPLHVSVAFVVNSLATPAM